MMIMYYNYDKLRKKILFVEYVLFSMNGLCLGNFLRDLLRLRNVLRLYCRYTHYQQMHHFFFFYIEMWNVQQAFVRN